LKGEKSADNISPVRYIGQPLLYEYNEVPCSDSDKPTSSNLGKVLFILNW